MLIGYARVSTEDQRLRLQRDALKAAGCEKICFLSIPWICMFVWTIRKIGIEQFIFGSDFPIFDVEPSRKALSRYGFSKVELRKIHYDNAKKLFNL